ncbi:MAG: NYN domain-containing protein [Rhodocyclales bacterium]|nr:NYN domain-containing protein [Rhodocyclales bacterium]
MPERAVLFVDGSNWYHSLRKIGVDDLGRLSYSAISRKLADGRDWIATRYYIGQVRQEGNLALYAQQRRFLAALQAEDQKISIHFGRLEPRTESNPAAEELKRYLAGLTTRIDPAVYRTLVDLAQRHATLDLIVEKAVDVMLAVDLVTMAQRGEFDAAYILSADGDFTPAVGVARGFGKKVFAASAGPAAQLATVVNTFIRLKKSWFDDCYRKG